MKIACDACGIPFSHTPVHSVRHAPGGTGAIELQSTITILVRELAFATTTTHPEKLHSHLSLPVANLLQPTKRHSRHLNSKAFNTIHASKNCYKFSFFPRTIKDWNSLPDAIVNITEPQQFKQALTHLAPNKHD